MLRSTHMNFSNSLYNWGTHSRLDARTHYLYSSEETSWLSKDCLFELFLWFNNICCISSRLLKSLKVLALRTSFDAENQYLAAEVKSEQRVADDFQYEILKIQMSSKQISNPHIPWLKLHTCRGNEVFEFFWLVSLQLPRTTLSSSFQRIPTIHRTLVNVIL